MVCEFLGFLHQDLTSIRLKGFKQTVNPSFGDIVAQNHEEPDILLGKSPLGKQIKSCDEINKLKAKFKKHESTTILRKKGFSEGGRVREKMVQQGIQTKESQRENRRTRYFSPKGPENDKSQNFRKN